jgi:predicted metalloprotease with PDZ domain
MLRTALSRSAVLIVATSLLGATSPAPTVGAEVQSAPTPVRYHISFENRAHREAQIEVHLSDLGPGPVELRMSRTSPGRYALHEFAKNVYDVRITDGAGRAVPVDRADPHQWTVRSHGGEIRVAYTLYADRADGTYSQVDRSHAHLNVPATFMFSPALMERPVELTVEVPDGSGWEVATQLGSTDDPLVFTAPSGHYFMDSPLEIADLSWRSWDVQTEHGTKTLRVAMHHLGTDGELDAYAASSEAIAGELAAVFGAWPDFEFDTYTFLACYVPWGAGDGMEHRNSTVLSSTGSLARSMTGLLGTVAHEFVHAWNIERIRPATLEPFDFEAANMSRELWFGEGFTSYIDDLVLVRAGVIDEDTFVERMGGIATQVTSARGRRFFSPVEMSMQAPFVDAATSVDPTNRENTFLSYYTWGSGVGLALDLKLRALDRGLTLDDLMREMWRRHGATERPYVVADVESALAAVTGDPADARDFFDRYVRGREAPDYGSLLAAMGVDYSDRGTGPTRLTEATLRFEDGGALVASNTLAGDPLYEAGVDRGDRIVRVGGAAVTSAGALQNLVDRAGPGARVELEIEGRTGLRTSTAVLERRPTWTATISTTPSAGGDARRSAWIQTRRQR